MLPFHCDVSIPDLNREFGYSFDAINPQAALTHALNVFVNSDYYRQLRNGMEVRFMLRASIPGGSWIENFHFVFSSANRWPNLAPSPN